MPRHAATVSRFTHRLGRLEAACNSGAEAIEAFRTSPHTKLLEPLQTHCFAPPTQTLPPAEDFWTGDATDWEQAVPTEQPTQMLPPTQDVSEGECAVVRPPRTLEDWVRLGKVAAVHRAGESGSSLHPVGLARLGTVQPISSQRSELEAEPTQGLESTQELDPTPELVPTQEVTTARPQLRSAYMVRSREAMPELLEPEENLLQSPECGATQSMDDGRGFDKAQRTLVEGIQVGKECRASSFAQGGKHVVPVPSIALRPAASEAKFALEEPQQRPMGPPTVYHRQSKRSMTHQVVPHGHVARDVQAALHSAQFIEEEVSRTPKLRRTGGVSSNQSFAHVSVASWQGPSARRSFTEFVHLGAALRRRATESEDPGPDPLKDGAQVSGEATPKICRSDQKVQDLHVEPSVETQLPTPELVTCDAESACSPEKMEPPDPPSPRLISATVEAAPPDVASLVEPDLAAIKDADADTESFSATVLADEVATEDAAEAAPHAKRRCVVGDSVQDVVVGNQEGELSEIICELLRRLPPPRDATETNEPTEDTVSTETDDVSGVGGRPADAKLASLVAQRIASIEEGVREYADRKGRVVKVMQAIQGLL